MRKISRSEYIGILVYISILCIIAAAYLLGAGDHNIKATNVTQNDGVTGSQITSNLSNNTTVYSPITTNQSANVNYSEGIISDNTKNQSTNVNYTEGVISDNTKSHSTNVTRTENVTSNQTTSDVNVPFVGDLKVLSITYTPEVLHKGEKGNFTLKFSWDGDRNSDKFTIGLYVNNVLVDSVNGWMDAYSTGSVSLYWTAKSTGEKSIFLLVDINDEIPERNESNNNANLDLVVYR